MVRRELIHRLIMKTNGKCWVGDDAQEEENVSLSML